MIRESVAVEMLMTLILERPLCVDCVVSTSGLKRQHIEVLLARIARRRRVRRLPKARCRACGEDRSTVSIDTPPA